MMMTRRRFANASLCAGIGYKTDMAAVAENLLRISGEDGVTVDRKFKSHWTGRLPVRFFIMSNEIPKLPDGSAVLATRFVPLVMEHSFFGHEDLGLSDRLLCELPSILNWAIEGWRRLQERGHFELPGSSLQAIEELEDMSTPVSTFLRQRCELTPDVTTRKIEIWSAWKAWCDDTNDHAGNRRSIKTSKPKSHQNRIDCRLVLGL